MSASHITLPALSPWIKPLDPMTQALTRTCAMSEEFDYQRTWEELKHGGVVPSVKWTIRTVHQLGNELDPWAIY